MVVQKISLKDRGDSQLYFRGGILKEGSIFLNSGERLSFDTYFSLFSYTLYRKYTTVESVSVILKVEGRVKANLCIYDGKEERIIDSAFGEGEIALSCTILNLPEGAYLYPVIESIAPSRFISGEYRSDVEAKKIIAAIGITAYKRDEYVLRNLRLLSQRPFGVGGVLVVDNGKTLSQFEISSMGAMLFENENYGGSAGFARVIMEAASRGYTHIILMDDDIEIYEGTVERITAFASILKKEYENAHFSAAMLLSSAPHIQHEMGGRWNGKCIESINTGLDVREKSSLIANLLSNNVNYGAWWCFCMPISDVYEFGLPLPVFIKFDDVEYGMRTCRTAPVITMNGMAVAHGAFNQKYRMHLEYYSIRNLLITLAIHGGGGRFDSLCRLIKVSAKNLFLYRYCAMQFVFKAFSDFLLGADFLIDTDADELNRFLISQNPTPVSFRISGKERVEKNGKGKNKKRSLPFKIIQILTLGGHIFPNIFLRKTPLLVPVYDADPSSLLFHRTSFQYQSGGHVGFILSKNSRVFFKCFFSCVLYAFKILFCYGRAKKSYSENKEYLVSEKFWRTYLHLDGKE